MKHFKTEYVFVWTYRNPNSNISYTKTAKFNTEIERNKFALEWFAKSKYGEIILEYAQEQDLKTWK